MTQQNINNDIANEILGDGLASGQRPNTANILGALAKQPTNRAIKDALVKNFQKRVNSKKIQSVKEETKLSLSDLSNEFQIQLGKIYENHTR